MKTTSFGTIVLGAMALVGGPVWGQVYQIQGGNVLDANNRQGAYGMNAPGRAYDFNAANRVITGNVVGGRSFQGYSPVRDSSSLFLGVAPYRPGSAFSSGYAAPGLPSDRLNSFQRDTYGFTDYRPQPVNAMGATPYYSPTGTVTNTGAILAGRNRLGTSQVLSPYQAPQSASGPISRWYDPLAASGAVSGDGTSLAVPMRLVRTATGQPITGGVNNRLLQTPLFAGTVREVPVTALSNQGRRDQGMAVQALTPQGQVAQSSVVQPVDLRVKGFEPQDTRVESQQFLDRRLNQPVKSSLDQVLDRAAADGDWEARQLIRRSPNQPGEGPGSSLVTPTPGTEQPLVGTLAGAGNVFGRMRQLSAPGTVGASMLQHPAPARNQVAGTPPPGGAIPTPGALPPGSPSDPTARSADLSADEAQFQVIKTFVGTEESVINRYLASGEKALKSGEFYRAASLYEIAESVDLSNPLPLLGRSMALLAAGDYITSASELFRAIQIYDSLGMFQIDLRSFLPDLTVLDTRRADLESRLELSDDYRLRFLLGYAEYCSGLNELGLTNMEKALESAPLVLGYASGGRLASPGRPQGQQDQALRGQLEQLEVTAQDPRARRSEKQALIQKVADEPGMDRKEAKSRIQDALTQLRSPGQPGTGSPDATGTTPRPTAVQIHPVRRFVESLRQQSGPATTHKPVEVPRNK